MFIQSSEKLKQLFLLLKFYRVLTIRHIAISLPVLEDQHFSTKLCYCIK